MYLKCKFVSWVGVWFVGCWLVGGLRVCGLLLGAGGVFCVWCAWRLFVGCGGVRGGVWLGLWVCVCVCAIQTCS